MRTPIARGLLAFAAAFILLGVAVPALVSYFLGASSSLCLEPFPANQIKSIEIFPEIRHQLFFHFLSRNGKPSRIRVHINPYYSQDKVPVLSIDLRTKQMMVYEDCDCQTSKGGALVPFSPESVSQVLMTYQAPHSPQQGMVDSTEVYEVLRTVSENDIRNDKALSGIPLKHYRFAYITPEKASPDLVSCVFSSVAIAFGFARGQRGSRGGYGG